MPFEYHQKILFKHCDPAGIVFYPRYVEMINDCTEDFFDQALKWPFETMLKTSGAPTVSTATDFQTPGCHGDHLVLTLLVKKLGTTSLTISVIAHRETQQLFSNITTLVCVNDQGMATPWPDSVRSILQTYKDECDGS